MSQSKQQVPNQGEVILDAVRRFLSKNKIKIIIGTPCFGGLLHNGYVQSILDMAVNFTKLNIPFEVMTIGNESLIQRARNGIVARFMGDSNATHLMFIDADITFSWISIVKLLLSSKELSGGCYPKKCFNWDKIKHHIGKNPTLKDDELMAKSLDYVFNPIYHKEGENVVIKLENGMAQVKDIGTGFMLIQKNAIHKMIAKFPETKYRNNVAGYSNGNQSQNTTDDYFYCLFDCAIDPVSRVYLSEDYLFCKRWIDIGGELWLDLNTNLNHTGLIDYKGCLSITIGEVDTLNKDAQIMRQQEIKDTKRLEIEKLVAAARIKHEHEHEHDKLVKDVEITDILSDNALVNKKKKRNKKKVDSGVDDSCGGGVDDSCGVDNSYGVDNSCGGVGGIVSDMDKSNACNCCGDDNETVFNNESNSNSRKLENSDKPFFNGKDYPNHYC